MVSKPPSDPPDGVIGTIINEGGRQEMHVREIEVVEYLGGDILETIKNKLSGKRYEPNTVLICFLSGPGGVVDLKSLADGVQNENLPLEHIFLAMHGQLFSELKPDLPDAEFLESMTKITLVQMKPVYAHSSIDILKDCQDWRDGKEPNFFMRDQTVGENIKPVTLENPPKLF